MPDVPQDNGLTDHLVMAGPVKRSPMGSSPIGWADLEAYCRMTCAVLSPGEAEAIIAASQAYYAAEQNFSNKSLADAPAPYGYEAEHKRASQQKFDIMARESAGTRRQRR